MNARMAPYCLVRSAMDMTIGVQESLARIRGLELRARQVVDGLLSGRHRGPARGYAAEFSRHREYVPGDDLRHLDWKAYARTGRHFLKQYHQETDLACWLLVDASESMRFASGAVTKYDHACILAAAMACLVLRQQDRVGLAIFAENVRRSLGPSGQATHLGELLGVLAEGPSGQKTRLGPVLHDLAERIVRRSLVVVLSDFFDDASEVLAGLRHLRYHRHEVVVFHVLDPAELDFPFDEPARFHGLEQTGDLIADPAALRQAYQEEVTAFIHKLRCGCREQGIDYTIMRTDKEAGEALAGYLAARGAFNEGS